MHMADALVSPVVAGTMAIASVAVTTYCISKIKKDDDSKKLPLMGVMSAFVFVAQMINFTIPGTGSSGHFCGGLLLSVLLGPFAGFISMTGILIIQSLLFADGGILALGCNIWNMAFYACFFGYFCIYKPIIKEKYSKAKIVFASVLSSVLSLQLGAFSVVIETLLSGITELPFETFLLFMQPIHLAIGVVEGLITAAVLIYIYEMNPSLIVNDAIVKDKVSLKQTLMILTIVIVLIGGGVSLLASSNPDGLEWSIGRTAEVEELESQGDIYAATASVQETTSILPDYSFENNDSVLGTTFSGILGAAIVATVSILICIIFKAFKKKKNKFSEA